MPNRTDLESAPSGDEGEIAAVEFDRVYEGSREPFPATCRGCGGSVSRHEAHVRGNILLYTPPVMQCKWQLKLAYFCDRECWITWGSTE